MAPGYEEKLRDKRDSFTEARSKRYVVQQIIDGIRNEELRLSPIGSDSNPSAGSDFVSYGMKAPPLKGNTALVIIVMFRKNAQHKLELDAIRVQRSGDQSKTAVISFRSVAVADTPEVSGTTIEQSALDGETRHAPIPPDKDDLDENAAIEKAQAGAGSGSSIETRLRQQIAEQASVPSDENLPSPADAGLEVVTPAPAASNPAVNPAVNPAIVRFPGSVSPAASALPEIDSSSRTTAAPTVPADEVTATPGLPESPVQQQEQASSQMPSQQSPEAAASQPAPTALEKPGMKSDIDKAASVSPVELQPQASESTSTPLPQGSMTTTPVQSPAATHPPHTLDTAMALSGQWEGLTPMYAPTPTAGPSCLEENSPVDGRVGWPHSTVMQDDADSSALSSPWDHNPPTPGAPGQIYDTNMGSPLPASPEMTDSAQTQRSPQQSKVSSAGTHTPVAGSETQAQASAAHKARTVRPSVSMQSNASSESDIAPPTKRYKADAPAEAKKTSAAASSTLPAAIEFSRNFRKSFLPTLKKALKDDLRVYSVFSKAQRSDNSYQFLWVLPPEKRLYAAVLQTSYQACRASLIDITPQNAHLILEESMRILRKLADNSNGQEKIDALIEKAHGYTRVDFDDAPSVQGLLEKLPEHFSPRSEIDATFQRVAERIMHFDPSLEVDHTRMWRHCVSPTLLDAMNKIGVDADNPLLPYIEDMATLPALSLRASAWETMLEQVDKVTTAESLSSLMMQLWYQCSHQDSGSGSQAASFPEDNENLTVLMEHDRDTPAGTMTRAGKNELVKRLQKLFRDHGVKVKVGAEDDVSDTREYNRTVTTIERDNVDPELLKQVLHSLSRTCIDEMSTAGDDPGRLRLAQARLAMSLTQMRIFTRENITVGMLIMNFLRLQNNQKVPFSLPNADILDGHSVAEVAQIIRMEESRP